MTDPAPPPPPPLGPPAIRLRPPRKWLGPAGGWLIFLAFTFLWFCNVLFDWLVIHNVQLSPNSLVLGGFGMVAGFVYTMAYRLRPQDGISIARLILAVVLGGLLSTQLAIFIESPLALAFGNTPHGLLVLHSLAGVIEEACKIVTVLIVARGLRVRNARTGLFIGGAVGFGFAAFEDMRYAVGSVSQFPLFHSQLGTVIYVTYTRDLFGPFDHPILTALLASALFAATRNGRFRLTLRVVLVYLAVAVVHGLIDTVSDLLAPSVGDAVAGNLGLVAHVLLSLGLGIFWLVYSRRVSRRVLAGYAAEEIASVLNAPPPPPAAPPAVPDPAIPAPA